MVVCSFDIEFGGGVGEGEQYFVCSKIVFMINVMVQDNYINSLIEVDKIKKILFVNLYKVKILSIG